MLVSFLGRTIHRGLEGRLNYEGQTWFRGMKRSYDGLDYLDEFVLETDQDFFFVFLKETGRKATYYIYYINKQDSREEETRCLARGV